MYIDIFIKPFLRLVLKKSKSWLLTKKGEGGRHKNQLANFMFYFSTNNEYSI